MPFSTASLGAPTNFLTTSSLPQTTSYILFENVYFQQDSSQRQRWSSLIGIITAIVGNIIISFALNIQRYAHIRLHAEKIDRRESWKNSGKISQAGYGTVDASNDAGADSNNAGENTPLQPSSTGFTSSSDEEHKEQEKTYLRSPYWWAGIVLMTIGEAGNFLAYGFAPASIVSPLGVVALVSNCVIAPFMLKEKFRQRDFWGVVIAIGGAVTVVLSAKQQERKLGPHEILGAVSRLEFVIYMIITIALMVVLAFSSPRYGNRTILIDLGLVGLFGGYTALSTKGVASLLSSTLWRALTTPVFYLLLAILIGTAVLQVRYVNKALQRFDSTQVIPVQFVMFTLSVIIGSAILYRDFEKATADKVIKFVGGCLLTFFGVFLITSGRPRGGEDEEESDEEDEAEETISLAQQQPAIEETTYQAAGPKNDMEWKRPKLGILRDGDAANDDDARSGSRWSSRVSFVEPIKPRSQSRRKSPNASPPPAIKVTDLQDSESTPLISNPWKDSTDSLLQRARDPGLQGTISTPNLPTSAQAVPSGASKPPNIRSSTQSDLHTPSNHQHGPTPPQADRPVTPARNSMARMIPGPYISPLSSGLSAIVADSLRRGVDPPSRGRGFRRPRLGSRRTRSGSQRGASRSEAANDDSHPVSPSTSSEAVSKSLEPENDHGHWPVVTRARSLSNTLGSLLRGRWHRPENSSQDEEAGPSGS